MSRAARHSLVAVAIAVLVVAGLLGLRRAVVGDPLARLVATPAGEQTRYGGSVAIARGGPVFLGFESPGPAVLAIDGRELVRGSGVQSGRRVLTAGAHALELVAPPGARLLWEPVGRRGPSEYLPASSLSPEPPARAEFAAPGTSRTDGALSAAIALVLLALAGFLARGRLRRIARPTALAAAAVFALALALRLVDLGGAGQTWDEDTNWSAGRNYVTNVLALDGRLASWRFNLEHPPIMKYVAGLGAQWSDGYGPARALSALEVALACALLVPIGRRLRSRRAGLLAGLLAALTPALIAHGKVVGHEAPTVFLSTLAVWLALSLHDPTPVEADRRRALLVRMAVLGAVVGLATFARFVNVLVGPLVAAILLVQAPAAERRRTFALAAMVLPAMVLAVGFATWPRLWSHPLAHLAESWQKLKRPHGAEPFLGAITNQPSRAYFLIYLGATAPLGVLVGFAAWLVQAIRQRERAALVIAAWLLVPLAVLLSPVRQDGVRYVMPSVVALGLAAALGFDGLLALAARRWPAHERRASLGLGAALALYLGLTCARIHPYYLDYFGEQVGGPATVARHRWFETAWWGEGLDRAIEYVNAHAAPGAKVAKTCVLPGHLAWLRADLWPSETRRLDQAEWILVYAPLSDPCQVPADAEQVFEVAAAGAPLARVYHRRP